MNRVWRAGCAVLGLLALSGSAFAYRLILDPTIDVLPDGVYKLELPAIKNDHGSGNWLPYYRADLGLPGNVEIGFRTGNNIGHLDPKEASANVQWMISKETESFPGYGIGVWNLYDSDMYAANKTSLFGGFYKTFPSPWPINPWKVELEVGNQQLDGLFGGVAIPVGRDVNFAAEYTPYPSVGKSLLQPGDTNHLTMAVGWNYTPNIRFKLADAGGDIGYSIVYTNRIK